MPTHSRTAGAAHAEVQYQRHMLLLVKSAEERVACFLLCHRRLIEAAWLDPDERVALQARIDHERKSREAIRHYKLGEAFTNPRVILLVLAWSARKRIRRALEFDYLAACQAAFLNHRDKRLAEDAQAAARMRHNKILSNVAISASFSALDIEKESGGAITHTLTHIRPRHAIAFTVVESICRTCADRGT
jgi:hypothetical protein